MFDGHFVDKLGQATSKANEPKLKMKHPSDMPMPSQNTGIIYNDILQQILCHGRDKI